jgi:hypothetical protein
VFAVGGVHGGAATTVGDVAVAVGSALGIRVGSGGAETVVGATSTGAVLAAADAVGSAVAVGMSGVGGGVAAAAEGRANEGDVAADKGERAMSHQTTSAIPKRRGPASSAIIRPRRGFCGGSGSSTDATNAGAGVGGGPTGTGRTTGGAGATGNVGATGAAWSASTMSVEIRAAAGTSNAA